MSKEITLDKDRVVCLANELSRLAEKKEYSSVVMRITEDEIFFKPIVDEIKIVIKRKAG